VLAGEAQANCGDQQLGWRREGQNETLRGDGGGDLADRDGDRGQEHHWENVGQKAVDEPDIHLIR
jgi:hypothetical protein